MSNKYLVYTFKSKYISEADNPGDVSHHMDYLREDGCITEWDVELVEAEDIDEVLQKEESK